MVVGIVPSPLASLSRLTAFVAIEGMVCRSADITNVTAATVATPKALTVLVAVALKP
ncbi:MAG: hypothetical protein LC792_02665 [Actinobacteria bacterium]|nr:hypothetical protein [Actinomycetota bacterium]